MTEHDELFKAMDALLHGKLNDEVIPVLVAVAARAINIEANGDFDKLSTYLLKFFTMTLDQATEIFNAGQSQPH